MLKNVILFLKVFQKCDLNAYGTAKKKDRQVSSGLEKQSRKKAADRERRPTDW